MEIRRPLIVSSDGWELSLDKYYIAIIKEDLQSLMDDYREMIKLGKQVAYIAGSRLNELNLTEYNLAEYAQSGSHVLQDILEGKTLNEIAKERKITKKSAANICRKTMTMLFERIGSADFFYRTLLYLAQQNDELQATNHTLQKQVAAIYQPSADSVEPRILPGRFIQNDTRINWAILREQYNLVLDRAIGWYEHYVHTLLQRSITDLGKTVCSIGDCLSLTKEEAQKKYALSNQQINDMERILNAQALTFNIPVEKVLLHFYYPYWAGLAFHQFKFSESIRCCLYLIRVETVGESMLAEEEALARIKGMGLRELSKLKELLAAMGLSLSLTPEKIRALYQLPAAVKEDEWF